MADQDSMKNNLNRVIRPGESLLGHADCSPAKCSGLSVDICSGNMNWKYVHFYAWECVKAAWLVFRRFDTTCARGARRLFFRLSKVGFDFKQFIICGSGPLALPHVMDKSLKFRFKVRTRYFVALSIFVLPGMPTWLGIWLWIVQVIAYQRLQWR